ncbi:MAG: hypothetical protein JO093_18070 [Acidobacteria bacterium]|nr:hypothetical protein [Acidobacteriota bacterium]MBV9187529.1 hypothetical protein [Acidobacteriota bacterium]
MRHVAGALLVVFLVALPAFAVDLGRAEGSLIIDGAKIPLNYAYAVAKQKNELSGRNDMMRIILTEKPLPDGAKLTEMENNLPGDLNGVIICIDKLGRVGHVAVQHPKGTYDGGYFEGVPDYEFKQRRGESGTYSGTVSSLRIKTNTMTFSYDATFVASLR